MRRKLNHPIKFKNDTFGPRQYPLNTQQKIFIVKIIEASAYQENADLEQIFFTDILKNGWYDETDRSLLNAYKREWSDKIKYYEKLIQYNTI